MAKSRLREFAILFVIYVSAFFIFQMNASAHEVACPPCPCAAANGKPSSDSVVNLSNGSSAEPVVGGSSAPTQNNSSLKPSVPPAVVRRITANFNTSMGAFTVLLYHSLAPKTVANFVGLAEGTKEFTDPKTVGLVKRPFFNGLKIHKVRKDFFIQSGDPSGTGGGGPGFTVNDEFHPQARHSKPGVLSMASNAPNTNGSQFFISLAPRPDLDDKNTVFGEVISGLDVVMAISRVPVNRSTERPLQDVILNSVEIKRE